MGYRSLPFCQVAKSYLLGITESQYRGERGARVPSRPSATGLVSQSATDRDDELRNHDELIAAGGAYAGLYQVQMDGAQPAVTAAR